MKRLFFMLIILLLSSCANKQLDQRYFQFNYEVSIDPTDGKKMELWIPVPQSNKVQAISNLSYDLDGLDYELKTEPDHKNKHHMIFVYLFLDLLFHVHPFPNNEISPHRALFYPYI